MNLKIDPNEKASITQEKLIKTFGIHGAINAAGLVKSMIPMYTGNLNPLWSYWDGIEKELVKIILPT